MHSIRLTVDREELDRALRLLGTTRRRRFSSVVPIWLSYSAHEGHLEIVEDKGAVTAAVPARGEWPPVGATVDLFMLRRAIERARDDEIDLHAVHDAVLVFGANWNVRLELLEFGPPSQGPLPLSER